MSTVSNKGKGAIVGRGETLNWFDTMDGEQMAVRLHSREVGGAFTIIEARVPPFIGPPLHFHKEREEIFEVLEGGFRFHCAGEEFDVAPGTTVVVPRKRRAWLGEPRSGAGTGSVALHLRARRNRGILPRDRPGAGRRVVRSWASIRHLDRRRALGREVRGRAHIGTGAQSGIN
jgi:mannose-6-phosphate isomerase-like protein (cupin superfamily)